MAHATVALKGTRLVFNAGHEVNLEAVNRGDHEVLLQAWLARPGDDNDPASGQPQAGLPFVVTPALVRLPGQGRQLLRVIYQGAGMPAGQESLLHLYVLEVPPRHQARQQLNIAVRQRLNVFYRPPGLPGDPARAPEALRWSLAGERLLVSNPTAFHVALLDLQLDGQLLHEYLLLAPGQQRDWPAAQPAPRRLFFKALTDYGGQRGYCAPATERAPFTARLLDSSLNAEDC